MMGDESPAPAGSLNPIEELTHAVIGAAIEVHRALGPGYLESVYEEALCTELTARYIPFVRQHVIAVDYKGHRVGESRADFIVGGALIVELKAVEKLAELHTAQVLSYLKATRLSLALLINFNVPTLKHGIKRVIRS
jgi:GxxExxY protein